MMRLVRRGLMFGNLIEVNAPALVARYNRALQHLIGKQTKLTEFHIDIAGYSPEIGDEFKDQLYLNPKGCNQQFILLTTDQKTAPLLSSQFSTSRDILKTYIIDNEEELFALTAREAVAGELLDSVFEVSSPADLFNINKITVEADTTQQHVASAKALQIKIDQFMTENDAWWDDVLISEMIETAKQTGNITRNPIKLKKRTYTQGNFFTNHFGGLYVFRDCKTPTVIAREKVEGLDKLPIDNVLTFADRDGIAKFLTKENLVELIVSGRGENVAAIIKQKIDFIIIATAAEHGDGLGKLGRQQIRKIERQYAEHLPEAFDGLMQIWRWASLGGALPRLSAEHEAYFYAFRSTQNANKDLVNMLLAELAPLDFRQLFICHKSAFYQAYSGWSDAKREYVSRFLADEYSIDKAGARAALFGAEPSMDGEPVQVVDAPSWEAQNGQSSVKVKMK